ncbi:MAG: hypothetical protein NWE83_04370 [Candidatus Bathyarchaeota archaeon]|nr:hypothetical protein [Candidatus Bathyarchaeota archaeon]
MHKILINYAITSPIDLDKLDAILDGCRSKDNDVHVKLFVFSPVNTVGSHIAQANDSNISTITVSTHQHTEVSQFPALARSNIVDYMSYQAVANLRENVILNSYALDGIDFSPFKEEKECGAIYSDYDVTIKGSERMRTFLRSPPIKQQMPIPCIFFNTARVINYLGQDSPELHVFQQSMVVHIPKSLYVAHST